MARPAAVFVFLLGTLLGLSAPGHAVTYTEVFDFGSGASGWYVGEQFTSLLGTNHEQRAVVDFDVAVLGNQARLVDVDAGNAVIASTGASSDASGWTPSQGILSAALSFSISSIDPQDEHVILQASISDGGAVLFAQNFDIDSGSQSFDIDFSPALLATLADGAFTTRVLSAEIHLLGDSDEDFYLNRIALTVRAVSEPGTLLLLGSGLVGLGVLAQALLRRRR